MNLVFEPVKLSGKITAVASKSLTHRAVLAASLCSGTSLIENFSKSEDVMATVLAVLALGVRATFKPPGSLKISGLIGSSFNRMVRINCFNSASTFRFLVPVLAGFGINAFLGVSKRLIKRVSCGFLFSLAKKQGDGFRITKRLKPGKFKFSGNITSQYISGLFFILPLFGSDSVIFLEKDVVSEPYLNLTILVLKQFGIKIEKFSGGYLIAGNQKYVPTKYRIEGDFSQAAFFEILGGLEPVSIYGLNKNSVQGDRMLVNIMENCGAFVGWKKNVLSIWPNGTRLSSFEVNVKNFPDLVCVLAVLASFCSNTSKIGGIARLKFKESNRKISTFRLIKNLGGKIELFEDYFKIKGVKNFSGGIVNSFGDHRVAMAAAVSAGFSSKPIEVIDAFCIRKSYVDFYYDYFKLGGFFSGFSVE